MLESELRELFERQAAADQPPPLVSISAICHRGRVRLLRRRAGVIGSPLLAVGVVFGLFLGGVVPSASPGAPQPPGGSPWPAGPTAYVLTTSGTVVPVSLGTGRSGRPIRAVRGLGNALGGGDIAIAPDGRTVYVSGYGKRLPHHIAAQVVTPIDTATRVAGRPIVLPSDGGFSGAIALTPDGRTGYVLDMPPGLAAVNLVTRTVLRPVRLSSAIPLGEMAIAPNGKMAYAIQPDVLVPIRAATGKALKPIQLGNGYSATSIAIAPDSRTAYIASDSSAKVIPVNLVTNTALAPIVLRDLPGGGAFSIAITPDGRTAYVVSKGNSVIPVDLATGTQLRPIRVPGRPNWFLSAMDPDGKVLYLGSFSSDVVVPVSTVTNTALKPITTPGVPEFITFAPDGRTVYVGNGGRGTVTLIRAATGRVSGAINVSGDVAGIVFAP